MHAKGARNVQLRSFRHHQIKKAAGKFFFTLLHSVYFRDDLTKERICPKSSDIFVAKHC